MLLYCIVLQSNIYKAPLVGWTVQRRSQCARPRAIRQVLREAKVEERLPDRTVERIEGESAFQREGPIEAKDRQWAIAVLVRGTKRSSLLEEWSGRWEEAEWGRSSTSIKYFGARPRWALNIRVRILNCIRARRGSQWSSSNMKVEIREHLERRAAVLRTDWGGERRDLGIPMRREFQ